MGQQTSSSASEASTQREGTVVDLMLLMWSKKLIAIGAPIIAGGLAFALSFLVAPKFTATAQIMPPQQPQGAAAALLGNLGNLAGAGGAIAGLKNPADQWVGLLKSRTIADALLDQFELVKRYDSQFRFQARKKLEDRTKIVAGKDGLIDIEVEDEDPKTAADLANTYISELSKLADSLAVTEAAQRRLFFERQLMSAKKELAAAETALRRSGMNSRVVKTNPEVAVAALAQLKAQIASTEVQLSVLRGTMTNEAAAVRQAESELATLRKQLANYERAEQPGADSSGDEYVARFRDFKYYETLFEMMARQFELAKADEAKQGAIIQIVDSAQVPEWKSSPQRGIIVAGAALLAFIGAVFVTAARAALAARKHTKK